MFSNNSYVGVVGDIILSNYSHSASEFAVDTKTQTIVAKGELIAEAEAEAFFYNRNASGLLIETHGFGIDGLFEGNAQSKSEVVANFDVKAGETFSLDFLIDSLLEANESQHPELEYNEAELNIGFLVLDSFGNIIDYVYLDASLISDRQIGNIEIDLSSNFKLNDRIESRDIGGNNDIDFVAGTVRGTYERTFSNDTNLTLLKINQSSAYWFGDFLIGNLGEDFIYGTIGDNLLFGTQENDKFYASFGNDILFGWDGKDRFIAGYGNDWLYGGNHDDSLYGEQGDDWLYGEQGDDLLLGGLGDDSLHGGNGNDILRGGKDKDWLFGNAGDDLLKGEAGDDTLQGGSGDDTLVGGSGDDTLIGGLGEDEFLYTTVDTFKSGKVGVDVIEDLEVNQDRIILSQNTFTTLTMTIEGVIDADELAVVENDEFAAISDALITYSTGTGNLFYNQNGSEEGFGTGGHFATLQNIPLLTTTNFLIV